MALSIFCALALTLYLLTYLRPTKVLATHPSFDQSGVESSTSVKITFNRDVSNSEIDTSTFVLRDANGSIVPAQVTYHKADHAAILTPLTPLASGQSYRVTLVGNKAAFNAQKHLALAKDFVWNFSTGVARFTLPRNGPGGPLLLITSKANKFSEYYAEILRGEGLNEFTTVDISEVTALLLSKYDFVLLGDADVSSAEAQIVANWTMDGGNVIAMKPDKALAGAFGISLEEADTQEPLHDAYIKLDSNAAAAKGLVNIPIQFHGYADRYVSGTTIPLAYIYKGPESATPYPAVFMKPFGRGKLAVFSYDLARSIVYTRQGNPLWSGIERDGIAPIRSDDLFYGASKTDPQPDWVDFSRIAMPQADEQQRLLANMILLMNDKPLPRFWYLPRDAKAVIVMTGDDHGHGGTVGRFEHYLKRSAKDCSIDNWQCIRATSNIFVGSISPLQADELSKKGFEIGLHVYTACTDWPSETVHQADGTANRQVIRASADALYKQQLQGFASEYPTLPAPVSNRTDCITWGDYDTQPQVELDHGIRLDTNYYYWPGKWVQNRPGLFTGSGMPMRFAKRDGELIDVYQAATQMTDESQQTYPLTIDSLLDNALGNAEYFGVFTVNMHNDATESKGADAIISAAAARHVPIVTAAQMLKWLDGRNGSSFQNLDWNGNSLEFSVDIGVGANGLRVLLPSETLSERLIGLTLNGSEVQRTTRRIAGLKYSAFTAAPGRYVARYGPLQ